MCSPTPREQILTRQLIGLRLLLTMTDQFSHINVTMRLLSIQFRFFARGELNQLPRSVRSVNIATTNWMCKPVVAVVVVYANSLIAPRRSLLDGRISHCARYVYTPTTIVVHTSRSGTYVGGLFHSQHIEKSIRC